MRKQKTIEIDGKKIVVSELTVEQIAELIDNPEKDIATLDILFDQDDQMPTVAAVTKAVGIDKKELVKWAPSDLEKLFKEVAGLNPFFVRLLDRLRRAMAPARQ